MKILENRLTSKFNELESLHAQEISPLQNKIDSILQNHDDRMADMQNDMNLILSISI